MKKLFVCALIGIVSLSLANAVYAQAAQKKAIATRPQAAVQSEKAQTIPEARPMARPAFAVLFGSVTKIDTSDPAKPKLEIKNDADGTAHTVELTPWTNVTKVTDISELKSGDNVRLMTRKMEDKEVAMTVVFGKIKNITRPRPVTAAPAAVPAQPGQAQSKK